MNVFRVTKKKQKNQAFWEDTTYLVIAMNYGDAEEKASKFGDTSASVFKIEKIGETTNDVAIILLTDR